MYKCRWIHCNKNNIIESKEDAVKHGKVYFHKCCLEEKLKIEKMIELFMIGRTPIISQLRKIINKLVYEDKYEVDYVLFCIDYANNNKDVNLVYPAGLYSLVKSDDLNRKYRSKKSGDYLKEHKNDIDNVKLDVNGRNFTHKQSSRKRIDNYFE